MRNLGPPHYFYRPKWVNDPSCWWFNLVSIQVCFRYSTMCSNEKMQVNFHVNVQKTKETKIDIQFSYLTIYRSLVSALQYLIHSSLFSFNINFVSQLTQRSTKSHFKIVKHILWYAFVDVLGWFACLMMLHHRLLHLFIKQFHIFSVLKWKTFSLASSHN